MKVWIKTNRIFIIDLLFVSLFLLFQPNFEQLNFAVEACKVKLEEAKKKAKSGE